MKIYNWIFDIAFLEVDFIGVEKEKLLEGAKKRNIFTWIIFISCFAFGLFLYVKGTTLEYSILVSLIFEIVLLICGHNLIKKYSKLLNNIFSEAMEKKSTLELMNIEKKLRAKRNKFSIDILLAIIVPLLVLYVKEYSNLKSLFFIAFSAYMFRFLINIFTWSLIDLVIIQITNQKKLKMHLKEG